MPLTVPDTISPGKIVVEYLGYGGILHKAGLRYVVGGFPTGLVDAQADGQAVAEAMAPLFNEDSFTAVGWRLVNDEGVTVAKGGFDDSIVGTNVASLGIPESRSASICFVGRGEPPDFTGQAGLTMVRLYTGDTYGFPAGQVHIPFTLHTEWSAFAAFLNESATYWADIYGQKAIAYEYVSPQFNAHWQRKVGA